MLAQNFKTPVDLNLTDPEFEALVKVLGMLERKELQHSDLNHHSAPYPTPATAPNTFNMLRWDCGTAHCIGGWAGVLIGDHGVSLSLKTGPGYGDGLSDLFYPSPRNHGIKIDTGDITEDHAAIALRNYLTFGEPRWAEAVAG